MINNSYTLEVRVADRALKEYSRAVVETGISYIEGREGKDYTLFFRNLGGTRVLVVPSVDGLSVMDGKPASAKSRGYIVNGYDSITIPGWSINSNRVAQFKFGKVGTGKTYVEALENEGFSVDPANQGTIGVMVFAEKYKPVVSHQVYTTAIPYSQPIYPNPVWIDYTQNDNSLGAVRCISGLATLSCATGVSLNSVAAASLAPLSPSLGTEFGHDTTFQTRTVEFERASATPNDTLILVYDSLINLRRRFGIIEYNALASAFPGEPSNCYIPKNRG